MMVGLGPIQELANSNQLESQIWERFSFMAFSSQFGLGQLDLAFSPAGAFLEKHGTDLGLDCNSQARCQP